MVILGELIYKVDGKLTTVNYRKLSFQVSSVSSDAMGNKHFFAAIPATPESFKKDPYHSQPTWKKSHFISNCLPLLLQLPCISGGTVLLLPLEEQTSGCHCVYSQGQCAIPQTDQATDRADIRWDFPAKHSGILVAPRVSRPEQPSQSTNLRSAMEDRSLHL